MEAMKRRSSEGLLVWGSWLLVKRSYSGGVRVEKSMVWEGGGQASRATSYFYLLVISIVGLRFGLSVFGRA